MVEGICKHMTIVFAIVGNVYFITYLSQNIRLLRAVTVGLLASVGCFIGMSVIGWVVFYFIERNDRKSQKEVV